MYHYYTPSLHIKMALLMWGLGVQGRLGIPPRPTPSGFVLFREPSPQGLLQRGGICLTSFKYPSHSCFICPWSLHECTTTTHLDLTLKEPF